MTAPVAIRGILAKTISDCSRESLTTSGLFSHDIALHMQAHPAVKQQEFVEPEELPFKDDGIFPNSVLPLLLYRQAFTAEAEDLASVIEQRFAENDWTNSWRNGVYSFAHYHSTTHEALGVYRGSATLRLGGEHGKNVEVHAGDVIVIPTGVAHRKVESSEDFGVVGAYPDGREWDLLRGRPGERPHADQNIAALPIPDNDPIYGPEGPLLQIWKRNR
ncbi:MAG: cupin [Verrucomicrobia bacterium]|nr:MAG: cupin [Verrucomicrobiota bacterium]